MGGGGGAVGRWGGGEVDMEEGVVTFSVPTTLLHSWRPWIRGQPFDFFRGRGERVYDLFGATIGSLW